MRNWTVFARSPLFSWLFTMNFSRTKGKWFLQCGGGRYFQELITIVFILSKGLGKIINFGIKIEKCCLQFFNFLGCTKRLLKYWTKGKRGVRMWRCKLAETELEIISGRLLNMGTCMTKDFSRKPRSLNVSTYFYRLYFAFLLVCWLVCWFVCIQ